MIIVDALFNTEWADKSTWKHAQSCHMESTMPGDEGKAELLAFARSLGLKPQWLQTGQLFGKPHYHFDLTASKRAQAIRLGACSVSTELGARIREWKARNKAPCSVAGCLNPDTALWRGKDALYLLCAAHEVACTEDLQPVYRSEAQKLLTTYGLLGARP